MGFEWRSNSSLRIMNGVSCSSLGGGGGGGEFEHDLIMGQETVMENGQDTHTYELRKVTTFSA